MLFIIPSKIEEKDTPLVTEKVEKIIQNLNGQISYKDYLGEKKFSYPIKHEKKGYYLLIHFELESGKLKKLEEKLKNISEILRFQIIKIKGIKEKRLEVAKEKIDKLSELGI